MLNSILSQTFSGGSGGSPSGPAGGDLTGTYPNPSLIAFGPGAATYGDASNYPAITVDSKGRIQAVATFGSGGVGPVGNLTANSPLIFDNIRNVLGGAANLTIQKADSSHDGYLSSVDWSSFSTFSGGVHNILSATHTDTLADTVIQGDIIVGNATPKWARLAANATAIKKYLQSVSSGIPSWQQVVQADVGGLTTADSPTFSGGTISSMTQGSILFAGVGGAISQDNANFVWDATDTRIEIGTNSANAAQGNYFKQNTANRRVMTLEQVAGIGASALVVLANNSGGASGLFFMQSGANSWALYSEAGVATAIPCNLQAHTSQTANIFTISKSGAAAGDLLTVNNIGYFGFGVTNPTIKASLAETKTLAASPADDYSSALRMAPGYTGAFTVTRHNYLDMLNPTVAGSAVVTDAAVMRFDANAGTHKAVDGATTKTTPGDVKAWVKININGTLFFIPAYTSKTS